VWPVDWVMQRQALHLIDRLVSNRASFVICCQNRVICCQNRWSARAHPMTHVTALPEQDCVRASTALLVTGEDPESEDGRRLTQVVEALHQVISHACSQQCSLTLCARPSPDNDTCATFDPDPHSTIRCDSSPSESICIAVEPGGWPT